jgi:Fe-S cluster biogenesis protein NfuA
MFIQTEATPNPNTLKFLPGCKVMTLGTLDIRGPEGARQSPLAEALFTIDGVSGVFFGKDFVSVTKNAGEWSELNPQILGAIMEHFLSGASLLSEEVGGDPKEGEEFFAPGDADIVATIKELLETRVRPSVAKDGGDIKFRGFRDGTVYLGMKGSCSGCPSSSKTLKHGIQSLLQQYLPDIRSVEQI